MLTETVNSFDESTWQWIADNLTADTSRLRLRYRGDERMQLAITQIECRRRHASKLAATLQSPRFIFPDSLSGEQSTSDTLAEFHASLLKPGERVLDMTAGLCIDVIHSARRAASVTAIEMKPDLAEAAALNTAALGLDNVSVINADSVRWIEETDRCFDTVFIDPARRGENGRRLFALADCNPDVTALLPRLRQITRRVIIKSSPMLDVSRTIADLGNVSDIYLTGTPTECKELVAVVDFSLPADTEPAIHAVTTGAASFSFRRSEEAAAVAPFSAPDTGMILHEPYPAVMKSGGYNTLAMRFNLAKLHPMTHLYTSAEVIPDSPTRQYEIIDVIPFNRKGMATVTSRWKAACVSVRNFILTAPELVRKLKIKEGGDIHLFGVTAAPDNARILIAAKRITSGMPGL